jgi:hypothetical protein
MIYCKQPVAARRQAQYPQPAARSLQGVPLGKSSALDAKELPRVLPFVGKTLRCSPFTPSRQCTAHSDAASINAIKLREQAPESQQLNDRFRRATIIAAPNLTTSD